MFGQVITTLASFAIFAVVVSLTVGVALALRPGREHLARLLGTGGRELLIGAWAVAAIATAGSLYLSGSGLEPCRLCWYQRIAMYPLVVILGVAVLRRDIGVWRYALPLSVTGGLISVYHAVVQLRPALELTECAVGVPCTLRYFAVFGFISIPWLAGAAFLWITTLVTAAAILARRSSHPDAPSSARP
ncbi:MAG: disulfide oxidoreductase [Longimicrobiales bacterium]|nr:disulfide oxidoreductase [Longimicrobiales bacterium]